MSTVAAGRPGIARFVGDELHWYRVFSFALRPRRVLNRQVVRGRSSAAARTTLEQRSLSEPRGRAALREPARAGRDRDGRGDGDRIHVMARGRSARGGLFARRAA